MEPTNEGTTRTPEPQLAPVGDGWTPAAQLGPARAGSRRLRWGIAGAVMLCVVLVSTGAVYVLSGASGSKSLTANVAPKNSVAFLEIRTDLPGDQHGKLADFMSHFPGFKDRSQFDTALDEVLNRLTRSVSPSLSYTSAFKPWMEGEVSIAVTSLGSSVTATPSMSASTEPGVVVIVALKDGTAADKWVSSELATEHISTTESDYDGTTLWSFGTDGNAGAYAFTDQDLLMGSPDGVKAAIDSKSKGSLADNPSYKAAMASLAGDSLARFYLDTKARTAPNRRCRSSTPRIRRAWLPRPRRRCRFRRTVFRIGRSAPFAPTAIASRWTSWRPGPARTPRRAAITRAGWPARFPRRPSW
jgi:hypothetical protein